MKSPMVLVGTVKLSRANYKRIPIEGGFTSVRDGTLYAQVSIYVDAHKLAEAIGWRAVEAKAKRSRLQDGGVVVECDWQQLEGSTEK